MAEVVQPGDAALGPRALVAAKRPVQGTTVVVLDTHRQDRGLQLEPFNSRALLANEIHEIILTDEQGASPGAKVDRIAYLGFLEITRGGVVYAGDRLVLRGSGGDGPDNTDRVIGYLAGFDMTHFPNHINLVVVTDDLRTGRERGLRLEQGLEFAGQREPDGLK